MINIITALGTANLSNELTKFKEFNIICKDIIYFEGIMELIEINNEIDYLIVGEKILENNLNLLVEKILVNNKKIKLILIINKKNKLLEQEIIKKGIYDIFYDDVEIKEIINFLKEKNIEYLNYELRAEIESLKKFISEKDGKKQSKKLENIKNKIIGIVGTSGIGKTTFCIATAELIKNNNKILIVDFDFLKPQIGLFYNKKIEYSKMDINNIKNNIISINEKIDLLTGFNYLFFYKKLNIKKIREELNELKLNYDIILIDTYFNENYEFNKLIIEIFDKIICLQGVGKLNEQKNNIFIKQYNLENINNVNYIIYKYKKYQLLKHIKKQDIKINYIRKNKQQLIV